MLFHVDAYCGDLLQALTACMMLRFQPVPSKANRFGSRSLSDCFAALPDPSDYWPAVLAGLIARVSAKSDTPSQRRTHLLSLTFADAVCGPPYPLFSSPRTRCESIVCASAHRMC